MVTQTRTDTLHCFDITSYEIFQIHPKSKSNDGLLPIDGGSPQPHKEESRNFFYREYHWIPQKND